MSDKTKAKDHKKAKTRCKRVFKSLGERIRTSGLLNPIQARYQTAPHPVKRDMQSRQRT